MSTIVTRAGKGSPLTWNEVDNNFTNLNTDKLQSGNTAAALTITSATINGGTITGTALNGTLGATTPSTVAATTISASGVSTFSAGSAGAPAITTAGDTNTGMFFPAADTIAFSEGGTESMRIDSSGNLGLGTASPYSLASYNSLTVGGAAGGGLTMYRFGSTNVGYVGGNNANELFMANLTAAGNITFATNSTTRLTLNSSGNLGLNVTPSAWGSNWKSMEFGSIGNTITGYGFSQTLFQMSTNYYVNSGGTDTYAITGKLATQYIQYDGNHAWKTAPSGTAGNAITFTQAMTLDASSFLTLQGTSANLFTLNTDSGTGTNRNWRLNNCGAVAGGLSFQVGASAGAAPSITAMTLNASGQLLLGTTTATNNVRLNESLGIVGTGSNSYPGMSITGYTGAFANPRPLLDFNRSRGTTDGSMTAVIADDNLGSIIFRGANGTAFGDATMISSECDGVDGGGGAKGRLIFATTATSGTLVERMRIDSSGNLLVGGTTAQRQVTVERSLNSPVGFTADNPNTGTSAYSVYELSNSVGDNRAGFAVFGGGWTSSGLYRQDGVYLYSAGAGGMTLSVEVNQPMYFATNNTERMRIDASGNLLVAKTVPDDTTNTGIVMYGGVNAGGMTATFNTASSVNTYHLFNSNATNNGYRFFVNVNGGINNYQANNANLSDVRTKKNIVNAGSYINKICAIPVRTFLYKDQSDDDLNLGVIAQEVEAIAPELVSNNGFGDTPEDGVPLKSIYQTDLQYALMKCIQEQQAMIDELKAKVAALEAA